MKKLLLFVWTALLITACGPGKNLAPEWISAKPIDASGTYVYGVGMSYVNPNSAYQQAARSNALADLAQEVESQIYDETRLLQKEDAGGFGSSFSSETLTRSHIKLEEYNQVDSYSDGLRYYTLYRMDLPRFLAIKAEADQKAQLWIAERLALAKASDKELAYRWNMLGDAVEKSVSRNFLTDPKFAVATKSSLIQALRSIEQEMVGNFLIPETVLYLGMPDQFSAAYRLTSPALTPHLKLTSSSGSFKFNADNGAVYCTSTGKENAVHLNMSLDIDALLPSLSSAGRHWIRSQMNWSSGTTVFFQNTSIIVVAPKELHAEISRGASAKFNIDENAPLTLSFIGELHTLTLAQNRYKATIDGRFVLSYTDTQGVIWTSQRLEDSAISSSIDAARNSAKNTFAENFDFFVLPQLERSLGY